MIVMLKRFSMDDVPVLLMDGPMDKAIAFARGVATTLKGKKRFAGRKEQRIAHTDIGTECISLLLVEFNEAGEPIGSEVIVL